MIKVLSNKQEINPPIYSPRYILAKMALQAYPKLARYMLPGWKPWTNKGLCHLTTVNGILNRGELSDKIVLVGDPAHDYVTHSFLVNAHDKIVADIWDGQYQPGIGYHRQGDIYPVLEVLTVKQFSDQYFNK